MANLLFLSARRALIEKEEYVVQLCPVCPSWITGPVPARDDGDAMNAKKVGETVRDRSRVTQQKSPLHACGLCVSEHVSSPHCDSITSLPRPQRSHVPLSQSFIITCLLRGLATSIASTLYGSHNKASPAAAPSAGSDLALLCDRTKCPTNLLDRPIGRATYPYDHYLPHLLLGRRLLSHSSLASSSSPST